MASISLSFSTAVREYLERKGQEIFSRLRIHERLSTVEEASPEESAEILEMINSLSEDDRQVVRVDYITC